MDLSDLRGPDFFSDPRLHEVFLSDPLEAIRLLETSFYPMGLRSFANNSVAACLPYPDRMARTAFITGAQIAWAGFCTGETSAEQQGSANALLVNKSVSLSKLEQISPDFSEAVRTSANYGISSQPRTQEYIDAIANSNIRILPDNLGEIMAIGCGIAVNAIIGVNNDHIRLQTIIAEACLTEPDWNIPEDWLNG